MDAVNERLREEWGVNIGSIPEDRLLDEIRWVERAARLRIQRREPAVVEDVTVKIPSRSEFTLTLDEARAVYEALTRRQL